MVREWEATKETATKAKHGEEEGKEVLMELREAVEGGKNSFCQCQCEIIIRFGLPCQHLMWLCYRDEKLVPPKFFHLRWFLDHQQQQLNESNKLGNVYDKDCWLIDCYCHQGMTVIYFHVQKLTDFQATLEGFYCEKFVKVICQNSEMLFAEGQC